MGRFIMFFVIFFGLYSCFHLFVLIKLKRALEPNLVLMIAITAFMALMVAAPALVRVLERHQFDTGARMLAYVGYLWMGLLFLVVSWSLVLDAYRFVVWIAARLSGNELSLLRLSARNSFLIAVSVSAAILVYGYFDALYIRTERATISTDKLPAGIDRIKIVQISDVHLGLIVGKNRLEKILKRVEAADPDLFVSTGDLVDGQPNEIPHLATMLRQVSARYGKYAVMGNHEFYAGIDHSLQFTTDAGFTILRGEGKDVAGVLNIAGVDDPAGAYRGQTRSVSEKELLSGLNNGRFTLLLKHRPWQDSQSAGLFDLQLSGHTHKGQIFPFSLIVERVYPQFAGLIPIGNDQHLYVSRGSGTWGPPVRFLAPPEVTVIELVRKTNQQQVPP